MAVAEIGRRSAVLRRRGPWPRRSDSRVRSPSRRSAPVRHDSFLFSSSNSSAGLCLFCALRSSINQPAPTDGRRSRRVRPLVIVFCGFGRSPTFGGRNAPSARAFEPGRPARCDSLSQVCHVMISSSKAKHPGSNAARVEVFLLGKRNTILLATLRRMTQELSEVRRALLPAP